MTPLPRFLQIHSLNAYTGALLNRDNTGLAKRMLYGGASRIRISSQSLKRHWRFADDPHALYSVPGAADDFRSRDLVTLKVIEPLRDRFPPEVIDAIEPELQTAVYGGTGPALAASCGGIIESRRTRDRGCDRSTASCFLSAPRSIVHALPGSAAMEPGSQ